MTETREHVESTDCWCEPEVTDYRRPSRLYRSKPSEVEAVQWTGDNLHELVLFAPDSLAECEKAVGWDEHGKVVTEPDGILLLAGKDGAQEWVPVPVGHWIVRQPGDLTDHWPVAPDYFGAKYRPA